MIRKKVGILLLTCFLAFQTGMKASVKFTDEASIDAVISEMTLEEKAKMVLGIGMGAETKINGVAGGTYAISRLGIPEIDVADGPVGLRLGGATGGNVRTTTAFPIPTAMASTWDLEGIEKVGSIIGYETKEYGVDFILGPALNIQRDPLGGRNFEYFTEDPLLNGKIAAAYVNGVQSQGVGATLKHFVANNTEANRMAVNQIISERALREIYLPGFEIAVKESKPWSIMSAYPSINGEFAAQNKRLLTEILRDEWKFDGFVMSDWGAVKDPVLGVKAGNNLIMPAHKPEILIDAVKNGTLDEKVLDKNIREMLKVMLKTPTLNNYKYSSNPDKKSMIPFIREFAAESMILLKNSKDALPLSTENKIGLYGKNAHNFIIGGGGSSQVNSAYVVQLTEGLKKSGYEVINIDKKNNLLQEGINKSTIENIADKTDTAMISIGRYSSEGADKYSMNISEEELELIKNVSKVYHDQNKKVVVLLNIGAPFEIEIWEKYVDSILITWQPGQEAGNAVSDIVSGKVNPSGKLTETFPIKYKDSPSFNNLATGKEMVYGEGILVGYRYYDTKEIKPQYEFGYGLSYTKFDYSNIKISSNIFDLDKSDEIVVSVDIRNIGKVKGKEIVQLYVTDDTSRVLRPEKELKCFDKIELLPNEMKTVKFKLNERDLSYYNENQSKWTAEPGKFTIKIGASSRDIKEKISFLAVGKENAITRKTSWNEIRMSSNLSKILSKYIDDKSMNEWYLMILRDWSEPFDKIMTYNLKDKPEFKDHSEKIDKFIDDLIIELNKQ